MAEESSPVCECCGEPNGWKLIDPVYTYVCSPCAEDGWAAICYYEGYYRKTAKCGCGRKGAINYEERYYCGGSPSCIP